MRRNWAHSHDQPWLHRHQDLLGIAHLLCRQGKNGTGKAPKKWKHPAETLVMTGEIHGGVGLALSLRIRGNAGLSNEQLRRV